MKTFPLETKIGVTENVSLQVSPYPDNGCLCIKLITWNEGYPEPFGYLTVNLPGSIPDYYAYIDTDSMPEFEEFVVTNGLGTFTGFEKKDRYGVYPLYSFNKDLLKELCPEGMTLYENQLNHNEREKIYREVLREYRLQDAERQVLIQYFGDEYEGHKLNETGLNKNDLEAIVDRFVVDCNIAENDNWQSLIRNYVTERNFGNFVTELLQREPEGIGLDKGGR